MSVVSLRLPESLRKKKRLNRGRGGKDFETMLKKAPDVEPEPYDRLTKA